jgi:hypothetical protein
MVQTLVDNLVVGGRTLSTRQKSFCYISSALLTKISAVNVMPHKGISDSQMRHLFAVSGALFGKILAI